MFIIYKTCNFTGRRDLTSSISDYTYNSGVSCLEDTILGHTKITKYLWQHSILNHGNITSKLSNSLIN